MISINQSLHLSFSFNGGVGWGFSLEHSICHYPNAFWYTFEWPGFCCFNRWLSQLSLFCIDIFIHLNLFWIIFLFFHDKTSTQMKHNWLLAKRRATLCTFFIMHGVSVVREMPLGQIAAIEAITAPRVTWPLRKVDIVNMGAHVMNVEPIAWELATGIDTSVTILNEAGAGRVWWRHSGASVMASGREPRVELVLPPGSSVRTF